MGVPSTGSSSEAGQVVADRADANAAGAAEIAPELRRAAVTVGLAGISAGVTAAWAETTTDNFEDEKIKLSRMPSNASPDQINAAKARVEAAQARAKVATAANLTEQEALNERRDLVAAATFHAHDMRAVSDNVGYRLTCHRRPTPEEEEACAKKISKEGEAFARKLDDVRVSVGVRPLQTNVAVAKNLRDIAAGTLPGRSELAREASLGSAVAAYEKAENMLLKLGRLQDLREEWRHAETADAPETRKTIDTVTAQIFDHVAQYRVALSANRAEWAAAHENAMKGRDAKLQKQTAEALRAAEQSLYFQPEFNVLTGTVKFGP